MILHLQRAMRRGLGVGCQQKTRFPSDHDIGVGRQLPFPHVPENRPGEASMAVRSCFFESLMRLTPWGSI